eukprot:TRINITY_DN285_c0_g4_i3.p4 TRINITY_DN285_c0_g4~~TRINITY_DN285_c0_g4_i3.p4  ORF type:complete len:197 (-),score=-1.65 TRINITY_DN285_c0_g4_i3:144-734(-)
MGLFCVFLEQPSPIYRQFYEINCYMFVFVAITLCMVMQFICMQQQCFSFMFLTIDLCDYDNYVICVCVYVRLLFWQFIWKFWMAKNQLGKYLYYYYYYYLSYGNFFLFFLVRGYIYVAFVCVYYTQENFYVSQQYQRFDKKIFGNSWYNIMVCLGTLGYVWYCFLGSKRSCMYVYECNTYIYVCGVAFILDEIAVF